MLLNWTDQDADASNISWNPHAPITDGEVLKWSSRATGHIDLIWIDSVGQPQYIFCTVFYTPPETVDLSWGGIGAGNVDIVWADQVDGLQTLIWSIS